MDAVQIRQVMRVNALFYLLAGLLLFVSVWGGLYDFLQLPIAQPEVLIQLGGGVLIGFAYVLSSTPDNPSMLRPVATGVAIANGLAAFVILVWLVTGKLGIGGLGDVIFVLSMLILAALTYFQYQISQAPEGGASRRDRTRAARDERTRPLS